MVPALSRRRALQLCASTVALSTAGCASSPAEPTGPDRAVSSPEPRPLDSCPTDEEPSADEWPTVGYDARNTGANPDTTGPKNEVTERWTFETGNWVQSSPAVANGTVYVTSRDRTVYALTASEGSEQWQFETGIAETDAEDTVPSEAGMRSSPTVVDGTVYVGGGNDEVRRRDGVVERVDNHNYLYALDSETGDLEWKFQPEAETESSPTVIGDVAYFCCTAGNVYAVDTTDGSQRWQFTVDDESTDGITGTPAVANCTVFVGSWGGTLCALDARDGSVEWRYETDEAVSASPAVHDGTVYVGVNGDGSVVAVSAEDGEVEWRYSTDGAVVASSPAVADGVVYVGDYGVGSLEAIDAHSGEAVWTASTPGYIWSSLAVVDGVVYASDLRNTVYGFDAADGTELWRFETGGAVRSSPAVVDGTVYVGSDDQNVYALTGASLSRSPTGSGGRRTEPRKTQIRA